MLSRLSGGAGDPQAALSDEEFAAATMDSPLAFGAFKLVAGSLCHKWSSGLIIDGLSSLHRSAGGPAALSAAVEHVAREGCHFIACLAVVEAIGWYADVGGFSGVDWAIADQQLRPGCVMKSIQCEELVKELRLLSQSYSFRHAVMLRWL